MGMIYPRLTRVREVSMQIAARVIHIAQEDKVDRNTALRSLDDTALLEYVQKKSWYPSVKAT
jgi:malate dehydrogenase (oxaloacetate-decarboxylating)(NADP+)